MRQTKIERSILTQKYGDNASHLEELVETPKEALIKCSIN